MSDTFTLNNRGLNASTSSSISTATLEASAIDRKDQLGNVILQLKRIATHLYSLTDEEVLDEDLED